MFQMTAIQMPTNVGHMLSLKQRRCELWLKAKVRCARHEEWLRADLLHSRSNELPLSDGKAKLTVRLSTPEEKAALLVVIQENGGAAEHDLLLAYLVNLDSA